MNPYRLIESTWTLTIVVVLALIAWALIGCTPTQCIRPVVTLERPELPTIAAYRLQALDDRTYLDLMMRDRLLHEYAETLEVTIREIAEVPQ